MPTFDVANAECCAKLGGEYDSPRCNFANIIARKHDVENPCMYVDGYNKGIEESPFPKTISEYLYVLGGTIVYFVPSLSKYPQRKDSPPPYDNYDERVNEAITVGAVALITLFAVMVFIYMKFRK